MLSWRSGRIAVAAVSMLAALFVNPPASSAGTIHPIGNGTIPSGPNRGDDEPGPGARITNKAFGYYIGRAMPGSQLNRTGGRVDHSFGRITGPTDVNICGWIYDDALGQSTARSTNSCSKATADRIWQRKVIGRDFSARAGKKKHSGVPVPVKDPTCQINYNYFTDTTFRHGRLRDPGGTIGSTGRVYYRYLTRDRQAAVIRDEVHGWGFVDKDCIDLSAAPKYNDRDRGHPRKFQS